MFGSSLLSFVVSEVHIFLLLFLYIYAYWCPTQCLCQMMSCRLAVTRWVSRVEQELLVLPEHLSTPYIVSGLCVAL